MPISAKVRRQIAAESLVSKADLLDDELVELVRAGDSESLDVLLHRYTSYARAKAKTYFLIGADREDIIQEGMIGLFKAVRDYDSTKTVSFRSFAELCITRQIITAIKGATRQKHGPLNSYVSLHRPLGSDEDDGERQLVDFLASARIVDPVEQVVAEDEVAQIRDFLAEILSELEVDVLNQYLEGRSYQEIAASLRRQAKSIDNALQRIKRKLESFLHQREQAAEAEAARPVLRVAHFEPAGTLTQDGPAQLAGDPIRVVRNGSSAASGGSNGNGNGHASNGHASNGRNGNGHASNGRNGNGNGHSAPRTAKPAAKGSGKARASARGGDLRASLKLAASAASRKGGKAARGGAKKPKRS